MKLTSRWWIYASLRMPRFPDRILIVILVITNCYPFDSIRPGWWHVIVDSFTVSVHIPNGRHGLCKGTVIGFKKTGENSITVMQCTRGGPRYLLGSDIWWRLQMETFSALLAICAGNSPVTGEFHTHKGQWRGALMFSLICPPPPPPPPPINSCVNNRDAGDLRRHHDHYDVTVM